ncbi:MAG: DUF3836 domain-containing protein [Prevotella sp.]|nr:DUF3836 domain-containing protein [Prevotella sp.]
MKKLVFATLMCVAAMSAKAQVLTSETVNNVYETVSNKTDGKFAFNVERTGRDIHTMYVFKKAADSKGAANLTPYLKYEYSYATDGMLNSRVAYLWMDGQDSWMCTGRYDYYLDFDKYFAEYSRYNHTTENFDLPVDKMVYTLLPDNSINYVSNYHRDKPTSRFQLVSEMTVSTPAVLLAEK